MRVPVPNVWRDEIWWFACDDCGIVEYFEHGTEDDALEFGDRHHAYYCPNTDFRSDESEK